MALNKLEQRIIDISYKNKLSHIGSCLNAVRLIDHIYDVMKPDDKFVLACGHAFLALAVVLEKQRGLDAEALEREHGTHPNRNIDEGIWVSTGSLGQGLPIAVGMALADRQRDVYVVTSDGDMNEGSNWEALRIAGEQRLENLKVACVANGFTGYGKSDPDLLDMRLQHFYPTLLVKVDLFDKPESVQGLWGHYRVLLNEEQYKEFK